MAPLLLSTPGSDATDTPRSAGVPRGEGRVDLSIGTSNQRLHHDLAAARAGGGTDRYDTLESTLHLALRDYRDNSIIAGLRLTPVAHVTDSLSWSMLGTGMQVAARAHQAMATLEDNGKLWDLTRLVAAPDPRRSAHHIDAAVLELLAMGAGCIHGWTPPSRRRDVRWIFTATGPLRERLRGLGFQLIILAERGAAPGETSETCFCALDPGSAIRHICSHRGQLAYSFRHVDVGLRKAELVQCAIAYSADVTLGGCER